MSLLFPTLLIFILFAFVAYPVWYRVFSNWCSSSLVFSVSIGWLIVTFTSWWMAVFQVPLTSITAYLSVLISAGLLWIFYKKKYGKWPKPPRFTPPLVLVLIFLILSFSYLYLRSFRPDINSLEKFPDMAIIFSIFRGGVVPPLDPFTAGETVNYYYLGHYQSALFSKLLFLKPNEFFHIHVASLFAITAMTLFSTAAGFLRLVTKAKDKQLEFVCGTVAAAFGVVLGNFQAFYENIVMLKPKFWYPDATRYIDKTIHEYPSYSFLVGDLHGHLMNMPFSVLCFALVVVWAQKLKQLDLSNCKLAIQKHYLFLLLMGFVTASSYLINAWDILTLLMLIGFTSWLVLGEQYNFLSKKVLCYLIALSFALVFISIALYLPYWIQFHPPAAGMKLVPPIKSSPFLQLVIIWLIHMFLPVTFLLFRNRFKDVMPEMKAFALLSLLFIFFVEFAYFKDIYPDHFRANTMFKIGIPVWFWSSICSAVLFTLILSNRTVWWKWTKYFHMAVVGMLIGAGAFYTLRAVPQAFGFDNASNLDGMNFMRETDADSYALVKWIQDNVNGQPILLEATGESFSQFGRISVFTGLPNVVQWPIHVWLWRGSHNRSLKPKSIVEKTTGELDSVARREQEVKKIYETEDIEIAKELLSKYSVKYVVVGNPEREKYQNLNVSKFNKLGKVVFNQGSILMYKLH